MAETIDDLAEAYRSLSVGHFYTFAAEFTSLPHYAPRLAVVQPFVKRQDGSFVQLEYRGSEVIPYAIARHFKPEPSFNGLIVCGLKADDLQIDERDTLCPQCGKAECTCQSDWANSINERVANLHRELDAALEDNSG